MDFDFNEKGARKRIKEVLKEKRRKEGIKIDEELKENDKELNGE